MRDRTMSESNQHGFVSEMASVEEGEERDTDPSCTKSVADSGPKLAAILRAAGRGVTGSAVRDKKRIGKLSGD